MKLDAEEWRTLRREFVEAAAKYDEFETFIERDESREDWYCNNGRYFSLGLIRWPHGMYRKCCILAPDSGSAAEPLSVMKTLFNKAWLWLPPKVANEIVETAEMHLSAWPSPPVGTELFWAKSDYQYWCWLLWFHWLRQHRAANPSEAEKPSQKIILAPFHLSAGLIAQWGLDGGEGTLPEWLAPQLTPQTRTKPKKPQGQGKTTRETPNKEFDSAIQRIAQKLFPKTGQRRKTKDIALHIYDENQSETKDPAKHIETAYSTLWPKEIDNKPQGAELRSACKKIRESLNRIDAHASRKRDCQRR